MSSDQFPSLYCLCLKIAVVDCANSCKFCKKEFRLLPDNVLFDFYNKVNIRFPIIYSTCNVFFCSVCCRCAWKKGCAYWD